MKIGIVARCDQGGLASLSYDFWKHMPEITKELVVMVQQGGNNPYMYPKGIVCEGVPTLDKIDEFLADIDLVLIFETPYNWNILSLAKKRGIKTVLIPNYEWSNPNPPLHPDLYLCPSLLDYDVYKKYNAKYLPIPVDRKLIPFKLRKKAETFVFNNGGGGTGGRNGMKALLEAIPMVKSDVQFIIRSQIEQPIIEDKRVKIEYGHLANRADLFKEGDVFLFPHMFNGLSLPIQEALSAGMPVVSTNIYPHNTYLPHEWLFDPDGFQKGRVNEVAREIEVASLDPKKIAEKIDEYANKDITEDSKKANEIAEKFDWEILKDKYIEVFKEI